MKVAQESPWLEVKKTKKYPKHEKNLAVDVLIVGGGITGVLTAYLLSKTKLKVALIEKDTIAGKNSVTAITTAHLTQMIDSDLSELIDIFGEENTKKIWHSHGEAIDLFEKIVKKEGIDCEFKRVSGYKYANSPEDFETIEREYDTAHSFGFKTHVSTYHNIGFQNYGYLEIPHQAEFHPVKFVHQLAEVTARNGVKIFEKTNAAKIHENDTAIYVKTQKAVIKAQRVIFATYWPIRRHRDLFAKKGEYTSYVYEVHVKKNQVPEGLYWDLDNPYHYIRSDTHKSHTRLIIGGEDHRKEVPIDEDKNYKALEEYIQQILGDEYLPVRKWSGPILETIDGIALIGRLTDRQLVATGFSGNGMTYAAISAMIFRDIILKRRSDYIDLYNPHRMASLRQLMAKGKDYVEEFFGGAGKNIFK